MRSTLVILVLAVCASLGCSSPARPAEPRPTAQAWPLAPLRHKLDYLSILSRGHGISADEWQRWSAKRASQDVVLGELVSDSYAGARAMPRVLLRNYALLRRPLVSFAWFPLRRSEGSGTLFLRKACTEADTTEIEPWWAPGTRVRVCSDDVGAEVWEHTSQPDRPSPCSAADASPVRNPRSQCRCGPKLMRCAPPEIDADLVADLVADEVDATIAYVYDNDLPAASLFTMNETWRSPVLDVLYARFDAESRRDPNPEFPAVRDWAAAREGRLAERPQVAAGQHAGILTSLQMRTASTDLRQRMRIAYEVMWCAEIAAPGALPEHLLGMKNPTLSAESDDLAARPICTDCHARLESAMGFFRGHPHALEGMHYRLDRLPKGRGPLFGADIRDLRGEGDLHPLGFGTLATRQPEFAACMARDVVEYVFGDSATPELRARVAAEIPKERLSLKALLLASFAEFLACGECVSPRDTRPRIANHAADGRSLAELLGEYCTDCHAAGSKLPVFEGPLAPATVSVILGQALSGRMPPTSGLPPEVRDAFLDAAQREFPGLRSERAAFVLREHSRPPPALPIGAARRVAQEDPSIEPAPLNAIENGFSGANNSFSPNYAVITAMEAARACQGASDRSACLTRSLRRTWSEGAHASPPSARED